MENNLTLLLTSHSFTHVACNGCSAREMIATLKSKQSITLALLNALGSTRTRIAVNF